MDVAERNCDMKQKEQYGQERLDRTSLSKTLAILSTFDENTPIQRTSDIAARLGLNISTVSRHLNTLLDWGFVERDALTGAYFPGIAIVAIAGAALQSKDCYRYAYPELQKLSMQCKVHGHMGVPRGTDVVHLISSSCEKTMDLIIPMGHRHPMYCSAMGRAILAYLPASKVQEIIKNSELLKVSEETKIDPEEIKQELVRTRQKGYCVLVNELIEGQGSIAAPIFDRNRNPVAAVSLSASEHRIREPEQEKKLAKQILAVATRVSSKMGYYPR